MQEELKEIEYLSSGDNTMQPAMFFKADDSKEARPLLVGLHTWSYHYKGNFDAYVKCCQKANFHFIHPHFRGPNWTKEACGSDLVVADIISAVEYVKSQVKVDEQRIYLMGGSGGGHCTLLVSGRAPEIWAATSAWCPISDIAAWHKECKGNKIGNCYSEHIELACGGNPFEDENAMKEAIYRSPLTYLKGAENLIVDISTGIHDGHTGSVPVSQSINAYNVLAAPEDKISDKDIEYICEKEDIPEHLRWNDVDPAMGKHVVLLRKSSKKVRLTIFEGGHDLVCPPGVEFLERQIKGGEPNWNSGIGKFDLSLETELTK